jgi:hypothetical protein
MKFALTSVPERYELPGRPSGGAATAQDAYKQSQFLLADDLRVFESAMNLQIRIAVENRKARTPPAAGMLMLWSRTFSLLADACALMCSGSYASCAPLLRTALDCVACQRALSASNFAEFEEWFGHAVSQDREHQALAIDLGRYRAGSVLAEDERLGEAYRLLTDLAMPHFGTTMLEIAPDSGLQKAVMAFGDNAFHLGWAELTSGWLLLLADSQLGTFDSQGSLMIPADCRTSAKGVTAEIGERLSNSRRCRVESVDGRFLFHNFRRSPSGQPRRILL